MKWLPVWLTAGVLGALWLARVALAQFPALDFIERLEVLTFDLRARLALHAEPPVAANLAIIEISDDCLARMNLPENGGLHWPWPRAVFGEAIREARAQGALVLAFDLFFFEQDHGGADARLGGQSHDEFLAAEMACAGNVLLATTATLLPDGQVRLASLPALLRTNAAGLGQDGIPRWGAANRDVFRQVPAFVTDPQSGGRVWHLGLLLAARLMGADLTAAETRPGRITIPVPGREPVVIPVDDRQRFYTDWSIVPATPSAPARVEQEPFFWLHLSGRMRAGGATNLDPVLAGRGVFLGSTASGLHAFDRGATPVDDNMPLLYSMVNAANSLLTGRFIQRAGPGTEMLLTLGAALLAGGATFGLRGTRGLALLGSAAALYLGGAIWLYVAHRWWLPVVMPLGGGFLVTYASLLGFRLFAERQQRASFGRAVSANVFQQLLRAPASVRANTRQAVTVYFADLRGFTRFVEASHARALARVREARLPGPEAAALLEAEAGEGLATVNLYVGCIADVVKAHDGTLDKYIGDCVMSFWGAPIADERHAVGCVRAAVAVHRAVQRLNEGRAAVNRERELENERRRTTGQPLLELLPVLSLGSALNSGVVTVGFMGSAAHMSNYTVFGREVNIASRLEKLTGADLIFITEATRQELARHDPDLARACLRRGPMMLEGVQEPVEVFEVPWQEPTQRV